MAPVSAIRTILSCRYILHATSPNTERNIPSAGPVDNPVPGKLPVNDQSLVNPAVKNSSAKISSLKEGHPSVGKEDPIGAKDFFSLPLEMRQELYKHMFTSGNIFPLHACRQTLEESKSLLHKHAKIPIELSRNHYHLPSDGIEGADLFASRYGPIKHINPLPAEVLAKMQNLEIQLFTPTRDRDLPGDTNYYLTHPLVAQLASSDVLREHCQIDLVDHQPFEAFYLPFRLLGHLRTCLAQFRSVTVKMYPGYRTKPWDWGWKHSDETISFIGKLVRNFGGDTSDNDYLGVMEIKEMKMIGHKRVIIGEFRPREDSDSDSDSDSYSDDD